MIRSINVFLNKLSFTSWQRNDRMDSRVLYTPFSFQGHTSQPLMLTLTICEGDLLFTNSGEPGDEVVSLGMASQSITGDWYKAELRC